MSTEISADFRLYFLVKHCITRLMNQGKADSQFHKATMHRTSSRMKQLPVSA